MNSPKCTDEDYINFIASPKQLTATEAARVQPEIPFWRKQMSGFRRIIEKLVEIVQASKQRPKQNHKQIDFAVNSLNYFFHLSLFINCEI